MIAPFAKKPVHLTLKGITTDDQDLSVRGVSLCSDHPYSPSSGRPVKNCNVASSAVIWDLRRS